MARSRITIEVDHAALFDGIKQARDGGSAVGVRLAGVLLDPQSVSFATKLGMAAYGVTIVSVRKVRETAPPAGATEATGGAN